MTPRGLAATWTASAALASIMGLATLAAAQVNTTDVLGNTSVLPLGSGSNPNSMLSSATGDPTSTGGNAGPEAPGVPKIKCFGCLPPESVKKLLHDQALRMKDPGRAPVGGAGGGSAPDDAPTIPPLVIPTVSPAILLAALAGAAVLLLRRRAA